MAITTERFSFHSPHAPVGTSGDVIPGSGGMSGGDLKKAQISYLEAVARTSPLDALRAFAEIAKSGVMSPEELAELFRLTSQAASFDRNRLSKALRRSLGRRLGPRSGAIESLVANRVFAPSFGDVTRQRRDLLAQNFTSRLAGLQGFNDTLRAIQSQIGLESGLKEQRAGGGLLGTLGSIASIGSDVASLFPGPQQPIVIGANAAREAV